MPWSKNDYPASFNNMNEDVRNKAIEIANALLRDGYEEDRAIPIAIEKARDTMHGDQPNQPIYEVKHSEDRWVLQKEDGERAIKSADTKDDLLEEAKPYVNEHDGVLKIYGEDGKLLDTMYEH